MHSSYAALYLARTAERPCGGRCMLFKDPDPLVGGWGTGRESRAARGTTMGNHCGGSATQARLYWCKPVIQVQLV